MSASKDDCCTGACSSRPEELGRALALEYLTVAWNVVEGAIAVTAAALAGSVALLGFGIDSFVECASGLVMIWRLRAERSHRLMGPAIEALEHRARRLVALSLFLLAAYVAYDAVSAIVTEDRPEFSPVGVALLVVSAAVMRGLAQAKRRVARELRSEAMEADAFQTTACFWLSVTALVGIAANGMFGLWWADPAAALVIAGLIAKEGRESWEGKNCC